ncbi:hypothetical protein K505DRAFT_244821, partial [Melanomma pulvis-pyrius CBS 109.77]
PMTWPSHTNLAPKPILFSIAYANFFVSVVLICEPFTKSFRESSQDIYQIVSGSFEIIFWATALVAYDFFDKASKTSLIRYACTNGNIISNSNNPNFRTHMLMRYQGAVFCLAIGAASAEGLALATLAVSVVLSTKHKSSRRRTIWPAFPSIA